VRSALVNMEASQDAEAQALLERDGDGGLRQWLLSHDGKRVTRDLVKCLGRALRRERW
jgi:hypothetical protein